MRASPEEVLEVLGNVRSFLAGGDGLGPGWTQGVFLGLDGCRCLTGTVAHECEFDDHDGSPMALRSYKPATVSREGWAERSRAQSLYEETCRVLAGVIAARHRR